MPDMDALLLRTSIGTVSGAGTGCEQCRRVPLAGECLHELESGVTVCALCLGALPEADRAVARSERVHTGARRLAVVRMAA